MMTWKPEDEKPEPPELRVTGWGWLVIIAVGFIAGVLLPLAPFILHK